MVIQGAVCQKNGVKTKTNSMSVVLFPLSIEILNFLYITLDLLCIAKFLTFDFVLVDKLLLELP